MTERITVKMQIKDQKTRTTKNNFPLVQSEKPPE